MISTSGAQAFTTCPTPVASAPPPRAIKTASNDGTVSTSSRPMVAAPSQVSMSRLSSTSRMPSYRAMAAARSRAMSKSPSTSSNLASNARMRSSLAAGAKRDATTVTSSPRPRPDQARAWPRLPALAHTAARESLSASPLATTSVPRALKLRTGFAVSSLMLTVHPRSGSSASQRYSGVSRKIGSIARRAARIRAMSRRVSCTAQQRSAAGAVPSGVSARRPVPVPGAVLSYLSDRVFEELENPVRTEVSVVPAAGPRPETQEEILAATLAARDVRDIPAEDVSWVIVDSDGDRPAELAGLDGAELDELLAATPARPPCPSRPSEPPRLSRLGGPTGLAELGELAAAAPAGPCGSGPAGLVIEGAPSGRAGFAEGGVLDRLAPGLALAGFADDAHAGLAGLTDDELIGVLRAWRRQASWAQARELAAIAELARRRPADRTSAWPSAKFPAGVSEFAADEVALALTLTRRSAGAQLDLALALAARPGTAAMLEAGEIDLLKARVIIDGITGLAPGHAAAVEAAVLPEAPGMTSGQLRAAVAHAVLAADPDAARRNREEQLKDARVECWTDPAGTANLVGRSLPCAQTLAADQRLGQIARAWKKQLGAAWKYASPDGELPRPAAGTDLLRARAYLALLLGQPVDSPPADLLPGPATQPCGSHTGLGE